MRTGENQRNLTELEMKAGQKAARNIGRNLRSIIRKTVTKKTGAQLKSTARAKKRYDALDRIDIVSPHYTFKQHYGFEGIKSNGIKMSLKPTNVFGILLTNNKAIEQLADEIGTIRAEEVTSKINW